MSSHHPNIDALTDDARLNGDDSSPEVLAILAAGRDIATQLGRCADHLTIEQVVRDAETFGRFPAGHPASQWPDAPLPNPNISTRDEAAEATRAATPAR